MISVAKAHAYGNDFLLVPRSELRHCDLSRFGRQICQRHTGLGADGLIVYDLTAAGASMQLFNADGSRAEVSGNGVRCLAALVLNANKLAEKQPNDRSDAASLARSQPEIVIETEAGPKILVLLGKAAARLTFETAMGQPENLRLIDLPLADETLRAVAVSIGNPQCVVLGALPDQTRFERLGHAIERHPIFPAGTNVEFAEVETPGRVRMVIWERGVGPTTSSGTGSCGAAIAAAAYGGALRDIEVIAPGGAQRVVWRADGVYLTGWAEVLFAGQWLSDPPDTLSP